MKSLAKSMKHSQFYFLLIVLISVCPFVHAQPKDNNTSITATASPEPPKNDFIKNTSVYSVLSRLPRLGSDIALLLWNPKRFTRDWVNSPQVRISWKEALSWTLSLIFIMYGLYALVFRRSPFEALVRENGAKETVQTPEVTARSNPRIVRISLRSEYATVSADGATREYHRDYAHSPLPSINFPEASKGLNQPQMMILTTGIIHVYVADMVPGVFASKKAETALLLLYALITVACIHPVAYLLGATVTFLDTLEFTVVMFSFFAAYVALLVLIAALLVCDLLKVKPTLEIKNHPKIFMMGSCLWVILIFGVSIRSLLLSYKTLYGFSIWKLAVAFLGGIAISTVVCPIIFLPSLYGFLKLRKIIELLY